MMIVVMKSEIEATKSFRKIGISKSDIKDQADVCNVGASQVLKNGDKI